MLQVPVKFAECHADLFRELCEESDMTIRALLRARPVESIGVERTRRSRAGAVRVTSRGEMKNESGWVTTHAPRGCFGPKGPAARTIVSPPAAVTRARARSVSARRRRFDTRHGSRSFVSLYVSVRPFELALRSRSRTFARSRERLSQNGYVTGYVQVASRIGPYGFLLQDL